MAPLPRVTHVAIAAFVAVAAGCTFLIDFKEVDAGAPDDEPDARAPADDGSTSVRLPASELREQHGHRPIRRGIHVRRISSRATAARGRPAFSIARSVALHFSDNSRAPRPRGRHVM